MPYYYAVPRGFDMGMPAPGLEGSMMRETFELDNLEPVPMAENNHISTRSGNQPKWFTEYTSPKLGYGCFSQLGILVKRM